MSETRAGGLGPGGCDLLGRQQPGAIDLAAGEDVTCIFANVKRGSLTVVKSTIGGDGVFTFTSQALGGFVVTTTNGSGQQSFGNLVPGVYDVTESGRGRLGPEVRRPARTGATPAA